MSPRSRIVLLAFAGALSLVAAAAAAVGLRVAGGARGPRDDAPLLQPRFTAAPLLKLPVLAAGRVPGGIQRAWRLAAADDQVNLAELRGRVVVVNFWASWCDPCRLEAPLLQRAWQQQHGRVLVLGVNQDDALADARAFLGRYAISYPSVRESGDATARRWSVGGFPVTFFIAPDGHAVAEAIGLLRQRQLERGIAAAHADHCRS
ncbi:MAG: TlpA family protein disulfide reductase [Solirubrobacteraceae bacterium]